MSMPSRRRVLGSGAGATLAALLPAVARAESYPSRGITLVVPFAAGGPTDTIARILAERMRQHLGQSIVVENVAGASGTVGSARVARAAPDGYVVGIGQWGTHVLAGAIHALSYDIAADFAPIGLVANGPQILIARKDLAASTAAELVAWLKANPGKATAGTAGPGSGAHVSGLFFQERTGTSFTFVPYRGAGPALNDLMAGHIDIMFDQASNALPQVRGGTVRALAVTARTRLAIAPDIPTVDEAGLPGLYIDFWHGMWAPKGTPVEITTRLNSALAAALDDADVRKRLTDLGQIIPEPERRSLEALRAHQRAEIEKWWPIVKAARIKPE
jgi:tripartite-type tricarboxylate transporter receptor subunit TctC